MKHCLVFSAFLLLLSSCQQKNIDPLLAIEGKWNGELAQLSIENDTFQIKFNQSNSVVMKEHINQIELDEKGVYKLHMEGLRINLQLIDENALLFLTYKNSQIAKFPELSKHIDLVVVFSRPNHTFKKPSKHLQTHQLSSDYEGMIYINYEGTKEGTLENNILKIPNTGLFKTPYQADPLVYFVNPIRFIDEENIEIPQLNLSEIDVNSQDEKSLNQKYVHCLGFNELERGMMNERVGDQLTGNVFMYEVNTLEALLKKYKKS